MNTPQMLSNLLISFAIACIGAWLISFESILAKTGGWILSIFGILGVIHAFKWFFNAWRGYRLMRDDPEFAAAIDRAMNQDTLSEHDTAIISSRVRKDQSFVSSGATWEQAQEDWKLEVDRLCKVYPDKLMKEIFSMASNHIKKKHPQFDEANQ